MKVIIKTLKMIGISIAGIIVLLLLVGVFFIYTSPQFGRKATAKELSSYTESKNFTKGKFVLPFLF